MLDITLLAIGRLKEAFYQAAAEQYIKRLKPYIRLRVRELPGAPFTTGTAEKAKKIEGQRISDYLDRIDRAESKIYLLAETGKSFTSPELAQWLSQNESLTLVIAGALGFSSDLLARYRQLSLSPLTFPHELARVVLLEQLYRATTILNHKDYHY